MAATGQAQLDDDLIDQQPDIESGGETFLNSLEDTALGLVDALGTAAASRVAGTGRMPYDPANPNVGGLPRGSATSNTTNVGGLVLVGLVIWALS
jgi:hypothetical protein